ncbi:MAG TPA: hypothetical protein VLO11_05605 [Luteolibacter sp.]|nr:hypothetical protein [Luteolibacter sp.]
MPRFLILILALTVSVMGQEGEQETEKKKRDHTQLRLICVSSLKPDQEVILSTRDDKGEWLELGKTGLRSSFISDWLPAKPGQLHLALPGGDEPVSICRFNYPAGARRVLVVLIADPVKNIYRAGVFDPEKMNFAKGSVLAINFSPRSGMVVLGGKKILLKSGAQSVVKPSLEANGMYRMLVAYEDEARKPVPCFDRYVQGNPDSRDLLFLLPDHTLGINVFSLPIVGSFD